ISRTLEFFAIGVRYRADITAGALKLQESRIIADLLLRGIDEVGWKDAIVQQNVLQARNPATAIRLARLIRGRLELMDAELWQLVRDSTSTIEDTRLRARRRDDRGGEET